MFVIFPTGTRTTLERHPYAVYAFLAANTIVFCLTYPIQLADPQTYERLIRFFGFVADERNYYALLTAPLLHFGLAHFVGNMLALWIFGANLEDRMGSLEFAALYLVAGACSCLIHGGQVSPEFSDHPMIGASGAVYGVFGAFLILIPLTEIRFSGCCLVFPFSFHIAAFWVIPFLVGRDFLLATYADTFAIPVAFWGHIGGFLAGLPFGLFERFWDKGSVPPPEPAAIAPGPGSAAETVLRDFQQRTRAHLIGRDFSGAWSTYQEMIRTFPGAQLPIEDHLELGKLGVTARRHHEAIEVYRHLANSNRSDLARAQAAYQMGEIYLNHLDQARDAGLVFQKLIRQFPRTDLVRDAQNRLDEIRNRGGL